MSGDERSRGGDPGSDREERSRSDDRSRVDDTRPDEAPTSASEATVEVPITGDLDLHSFAPREIPSVVEEYVRACRERGILEVRLAHGKGTGVQRAVVRRALRSMRGVISFSDAPAQRGGWGATIAQLRPLPDE